MIEILTLFFGLFNGVQTVSLAIDEPVARVEVWVDGKALGKISKPPWSFKVDLGDDLKPHELLVIARDSELRQLGRVRKWINLDPAPDSRRRDGLTAVVITLESGASLPAKQEMQTWFRAGGIPLEVERIEDIGAEVWIVRDPSIQPFLDQLAAVFLRLHLGSKLDLETTSLAEKERFLETVQNFLRRRGELEISDKAAQVWEKWSNLFNLGDDLTVRLISPQAAPVSKVAESKQIFKVASALHSQGNGLLWHAVKVRPLEFRHRATDAVALAGLEAGASHKRRAVLLLLGDDAKERSRYTPAAVRSYLRDIQVPLFVWDFKAEHQPAPNLRESDVFTLDDAGSPQTGWAHTRAINPPTILSAESMENYLGQVESVAEELRENLESQRIVWLRGAYLPTQVELSEAVQGVALAGQAQ